MSPDCLPRLVSCHVKGFGLTGTRRHCAEAHAHRIEGNRCGHGREKIVESTTDLVHIGLEIRASSLLEHALLGGINNGRADLCRGPRRLCCHCTTAAEPARCGVAIEVPCINAQHGAPPQNDKGIELSTFTPGATTSGLTRKSTSVGPWLLNAAMKLSIRGVVYILAGPLRWSRPIHLPPTSASLSARLTMYAGIVGWFGVPSCPIAVGAPGTLLTISAATAPASCAFRILVENVHVPREITAILPVRLPGGRAEQA